jgi:hypothetical protein
MDEALILGLALEHTEQVMSQHPEGSFEHILWEQQMKAASVHDSRSMQWHTLFINPL